MRLLILTARFGSGYGMGYATYKEATALAELGHMVTVVYCNPDPDITSYKDKRINYIHLPIIRKHVIGLTMFYFAVRSFFKNRVNFKYFDAIYIQSLEFGWINFKKLKMPVFYFVRSTILGPLEVLRSENIPASLLDRAVNHLLVFLERRCLRYSKVIFVKSRIMIDEVSKFYGVNSDKMAVINGGVDVKDFSFLPNSALVDLKNELSIPLDSFVVLYVGRIVPQKGLRYLVEASFRLFPRFNFVVVVAGASLNEFYAAKIKNLVAKSSYRRNFYFLDHIDQLKISPIFNLADCLILPSSYEPFGMVNLQAAFLGKNIITTDAVGSIDLLVDYKNMKVVKANSSDAIADALQELLSKNEPPNQTDKNFNFSCYSWSEVAKQLLTHFMSKDTPKNKVKNDDGSVMKGGGIVAKKEGDQIYILILYRGNHNDWSFPKGYMEYGETVQQTVIREVEEKGGIKSEIIKELIPNKYFNYNGEEETVCYMFLLKPTSGEVKSEHEGDKVEWVPLEEVSNRLSYPNLRDYFNEVAGDVVGSI